MYDSFLPRSDRERAETLKRLADVLPATVLDGPKHSGLRDAAPKFSFRRKPSFSVEFCDEGRDIVYHFWPPAGTVEFRPNFAVVLEAGFQQVLPPSADVRAEWTSRKEALAQLLMAADEHPSSSLVRESYYVRVVGWADNPLADRMLKNRVFDKIEEAGRLLL